MSILIVADGKPPKLSWSNPGSKKKQTQTSNEKLWSVNGKTAYRYEIAVPLQDKESSFQYSFDAKTYQVFLPRRGGIPRFAYASCNGFSSLKLMKTVDDKNKMWKEMAAQHAKSPIHLLPLGGDQVYADAMWETIDSMKQWNELGWDQANAAPFTMAAELEDFYFNLYVDRWSQPEIAQILATVPTIMMWDDHDIIDGWGSYPQDRHNCPVFQGMFQIARKAFAVFQRHLPANARSDSMAQGMAFTAGYVLPQMAILALDMRNERTEQQVISPAHWEKVYNWLDSLNNLDHLIILSSIPLIYTDFNSVENVLGIFPGQQELEDDLRDHWLSRSHKEERLRFIHRLLSFAQQKKIRPTVLSGDVHLAALGVVESNRTTGADLTDVINQLISSAIVHPPPPAIMLFALRNLLSKEEDVDRGVTARMINFPGTQYNFIGKRNFLLLNPDGKDKGNRLWANWHVDNEPEPFVKVIHPIGYQQA
ncbi:MAG: alkaline phosphatase family protein [Burkholderiaceae bacterium]|nr:alkaline phosphatase family protein [Burkholderiaceae bacterium]